MGEVIVINKRKLIVAISTAVLIFIVGTLLAIAEFQELALLKKFKDSVPHDVFINKENKCLQLILSFLMLAIGGSLLAFSTIYRGFYFNNKLYDKVSLIIGLVVTFFVNIFAKFDGIWTLFVGIAIITFDCIFLFIKEEYDSLIAKKKAKNTSCLKEDVV